jgi:hypothetical protein
VAPVCELYDARRGAAGPRVGGAGPPRP